MFSDSRPSTCAQPYRSAAPRPAGSRRRAVTLVMTAFALAAAFASLGCEYEVLNKTSTWDQLGGKEVKPPPEKTALNPLQQQRLRAAQPDVWAIRLSSAEGDKAEERIRTEASYIQATSGLTNLWIHADNGKYNLYHGKFADPNSTRATNSLRQVRLTRVDGLDVFKDAKLELAIRPERPDATGKTEITELDPVDLKQYAGRELYTLLVAEFSPEGGSNFREAAEAHARQLREEGYPAYFMHTDNSAVTVGLFKYDEAFVGRVGVQDSYSPAIRRLQKRFPKRLLNGMTVRRKTADGESGPEMETIVVRPR